MQIIILSNITKYHYHINILQSLKSILPSNDCDISHIDISDKSSSELSMQLSALSIDYIITLDLAGFELKTLTGECLLNMLPCTILNIIWGDKPQYEAFLSKKLSLSMLFYDATGDNHHLNVKYPYLRFYYPTSDPINPAPENNKQTVITLQSVLAHFKEETLLA